MIRKFISWIIKNDIEKLVNEKVGCELSARFAKTEEYFTERVNNQINGELKEIRSDFIRENSERFRYQKDLIEEKFNENGPIHIKVDHFVADRYNSTINRIKEDTAEMIEGEAFIDKIVDRIKRKQLK